jgi:thioredoxin reductase (NADPH)
LPKYVPIKTILDNIHLGMILLDDYDVLVIGGGPAGLSAGVIASYKGLKTAIFEGGTWGGLMSTIYPQKEIFNFPGFPRIRAEYLVSNLVRQAADQAAYLIKERVLEILPNRTVATETETYSGKVVIIATGMRPSELGVPGERKFSAKDRGVYPYVTDPTIFQEKRVLVVGGGDSALDAVIDLSKIASKIFLAHRRASFRGAESVVEKILTENLAELLFNTELQAIEGGTTVEKAILKNNQSNAIFELPIDKIILAVGLVPNTEVFQKLGLEMDGKYIKVDHEQRTSIEGVFAVGDIVSPYQLATIAAAQGALAAHTAYKYIRKPYWEYNH